jgi:hypothetical protein
MSLPFTFGVELEFNVALMLDENGSETKIVLFARVEEDKPSGYRTERGEPLFETLEEIKQEDLVNVSTYKDSVIQHIRNTIRKANFPIDSKNLPGTAPVTDITGWQVITDNNIEGPVDPGNWGWVGIEVISPSYEFTAESLKTVEDICLLLTSTYQTEVNETTGLHVQIGHKSLGFKFQDIQKLIAFLWTFEPQLQTLHSPFRLDREYVHSLRERSNFSNDWRIKWGKRPRPVSGAASFFKCQDIKSVVRDASDPSGPKKINVNLINLMRGGIGTVKFRQHEGTLEGPRVTVWIKTLIGIIEFIENVHPVTLFNLLATACKHEKWEKLGDGTDFDTEQRLGPILAESDFTIIHLPEYLSLWDSAHHYKGKMHQHSKKTVKPLPKGRMEWDYESTNYKDSTEGRRQHALRLL